MSVEHPGVGDDVDRPRCSAKGCRTPATEDLRWRNPRLHDTARVKHWLACAEHADGLAGFLAARDFLLGRGPADG
ncbi:MAG: acetone carboxylase [Actinomycetota bacterium]|nr:acetone carboxylase [Actinomycetota bacterium]